MAKLVCQGALTMCSQGVTPCPLTVTSNLTVLTNNLPVATVFDFAPQNIMGFGMCRSSANPAVAAANGVPQPCTPIIASPWAVGSPTVKIQNSTALNDSAKLNCAFAGEISIKNPIQQTVMVP